jgi:PKHD-type hydroxylase
MQCRIFQVLSAEEVNRVRSILSESRFADGKKTAFGRAREVKHNLQAERDGPELTDCDRLILEAFRRNGDFQGFAYPRRVIPPTFSRYEAGMQYGAHVDSAIMGSGESLLRTDLASTLFLCDPAAYDGGELVIEAAGGEQEIKLEAGEAVVYSATSLHRVNAVTRGVRLVALTWIQSMVPDDRLRAILSDLYTAVQKTDQGPDAELAATLNKSYHNLLRYAITL